MKQNKFLLGQRVIVVEGRNIVEKEVQTIELKNGQVHYSLSPGSKSQRLVVSHDPSRARRERNQFDFYPRLEPIDFSSVLYGLDWSNDHLYPEAELYANEAEFRQNVPVKLISPKTAELVEHLEAEHEELADNPSFTELKKRVI